MSSSFRRPVYLVVVAILAAALGPLAGAPRHKREADYEQDDTARRRAEWFYRQRAFPHVRVPAGARSRALQQHEEMKALAELSTPRFATRAPSMNWKLIGPQPTNTPYTDPIVSGRVDALAVDPRNSNTVYLGAAEGGVWKTTDGGATWVPLTDNQPSLSVGSIALDPSHPDTVYVGTGEENFSGDSYYGEGILKSTDAGATWIQIRGPFAGPVGPSSFFGGGARIGSLSVHPTNGQVVLAAVEYFPQSIAGIYRSADGGITWTLVLSGASGTGVVFDPTNGNLAYAALGNINGNALNGVYKSTDGGTTWAVDNGTGVNKLPSLNVGRIALALAPSSPATLYAGIHDITTGNLLGIFKSVDAGADWTKLSAAPDYCSPQCWYDNTIAVQPTNANVLYAGGAFQTTLIRSLDGGTTWQTLQSAANFGFMHADVHALAFFGDGSLLYVGNDGGAYKTSNPVAAQVNFTALNNTLAITQFYPGFSISPGNVAVAFGGTQDNGTQAYAGTAAWKDVACGDGSATPIDPSNSNIVYTNCTQFDIRKSTSGGSFGSWSAANSGVNTNDRVEFIPPLVIDPGHPQTLYFGTQFLYQTKNGAGTWTAISPDLTGGDPFSGNLSAIAVAPGDSNTVYTASGDGLSFVTTNAGLGTSATFRNITAGLPPRFPTHLAVDPVTSVTAFVTYSGFSGFGDTQGHVFQTLNGGTTWTDISGNLPNIPANDLVVEPNLPNTLYLATDLGVYFTTSGGASWSPLGSGMPNVSILGLALHKPTHTLRAASHGRSVWDFDLSSVLPIPAIGSLSPASASAGAAAFTLMVNGSSFLSSSVVQWNGVARSTTFVNSTQLQAAILASDVAVAGTAQVTVMNPAGQGGTSAPATFSIVNPAPVLVSISPANALVAGPAFTVTATGSNFVPGSVVQWNGTNLVTTFVSTGKLTASVPAAKIAAAGTATLTVSNPGPGGGISGPQTFTINNPAPSLAALMPSSAITGGPAFTLTLTGTNFLRTSVVQWNGSNRPTTFSSNTKVTAAITAADIGVAGTSSVAVFNPLPGGGNSAVVMFSINNPVPAITSLSPASATAGGPAFTLTVNGKKFVSSAVVMWNGSARNTTFVSAIQLKAAILAGDIAQGQVAHVVVANPAPGGGTSAMSNYTVNNPAPSITALSPPSAKAGGPGFMLTITGAKFVPTSQVRWKGLNRATTFVSATQIKAAITAQDIAIAGTAAVTVFNPAPQGGTSAARTFTITP